MIFMKNKDSEKQIRNHDELLQYVNEVETEKQIHTIEYETHTVLICEEKVTKHKKCIVTIKHGFLTQTFVYHVIQLIFGPSEKK